MADAPPLSVLMSVHNGERYLREAVESILGQTFRSFELVIVDDASTDGTAAILAEFAARDERVVTVRNETNLRLAASLNRGLDFCRAQMVARADADDVSLPTRLEKQVAFMRNNAEVGLISSNYVRMNENGEKGDAVELPAEDGLMKFMLLWMTPICHASAVFRRELVRIAGGYDPEFWTAQDYELWSRLAPMTKFGNVPEVLLRYRTHASSTTGSRGRSGAQFGHRVSRRVMSAYLGRELTQDEATLLKRLLNGFDPLEPEEYPQALVLLRELFKTVDAREGIVVRDYAHDVAAKALLQHSSMLSYTAPQQSRELLDEAVRIVPALKWNKSVLKQRGRLSLVGPVRRLRAR